MLTDVNLLRLTIKQVAAKLRNGQLTASELCEQCIQQATKLQELNMFITTTSVEARDAAMKADKRLKIGQPLSLVDGVPFAVKDNFSTTGIKTTCASRMLHNYVPPYDATVVERLYRAGGALMGKTNLDEFAMGSGSVDGAFGAVRNPWQYRLRKKAAGKMPLEEQQELLVASATGSQTGTASPVQSIANAEKDSDDWFIAGGSSGGSAVAVATGAAFIAIGSDTGGSTRNPAAYCGVVGLKPTYGLVSRHGLIPLVNSMDVPGVLTRCVDDAVIALNLLAGHCERDSTTVTDPYEPFEISDSVSVKGLTVGIPIEYHAPGTSAEVVGAWERVARLLETGGATVRQVSLPHTQHSIVCYSVLCASEVASNMARYDGIEYGLRADDESSTEALYAASRRAGFNDVVRGRILAGNYFALKRNYDEYLVKAQKLRRLIAEDFKAVYASGVDILLTPAVLGDAPAYSFFSKADNRTRTSEQDVFTQPANMAGIPALVLPVQTSKRGLPIGLQLLGPSFSERRLLEVAKWIEQRVEFPLLNLNAL